MEEAKQEKKKKKGIGLVVSLLIIAVISFIGYSLLISMMGAKGQKEYEVISIISEENSMQMRFKEFGDGIIKSSKDGATYVNIDGSVRWNQSYTIKNPIIKTSNNYAVVADIKGNTLYIFDKKGSTGKVTTEYPITEVSISQQGVVAAVLEDTQSNYINIYNKDGTMLINSKTNIEKNGYPLSISLSDDATKLATSYIYTNGKTIESRVNFYNYGEVGKNYVDRLVGAYIYESTVIPKIEFVTNDRVVAYGDNKIAFYKMEYKPEEMFVKEIEEEIKSVFSNNEYIGLIIKDSTQQKLKLVTYNHSGKEAINKYVDMMYRNIKANKNEIIMYDDLQCEIYTMQGKLKFKHNFSKTIYDIIPIGKSDQYVIVNGISAEVIKTK